MEKKKLYTEAQKRAIYKYREKNKEKTSELLSNWKTKNIGHVNEYAKSYYEKNKEQKKEQSLCEHGKYKATCRDCGGSRICKHCKNKQYCKDCGGSAVCKGAEGTCATLANPKYKGYCTFCFQQTFPLDPLSFQIRCKTKEIAVRDFINANFEGFHHDKPLYVGACDCSTRRRIDHRILIGNTLLCIETDEKQHKSYNQKDEEIRYDDLMMIHGGKFIFIRFNPDKYKINGKSVNPMMYTRLTVLKKEIEKQITRIHEEENDLIEIIHLFFDSY